MDDLGSDQLCKLSSNSKIRQSAIYDNTATPTTTINNSTNSNEKNVGVETVNSTASTPGTATNLEDRLNIRIKKSTTNNSNKTTTTASSEMNCEKNNDCDDDSNDHSNSQTMGAAVNADVVTRPRQRCGSTCDSLTGMDSYFGEEDSVDEEKEKTDATPENVKKIVDDVIASNCGRQNFNIEMSGKCDSSRSSRQKITNATGENENNENSGGGVDDYGIELKIVEDESPTKQCLAFTIDFSEGESSAASTAATKARYKNMVERFQNRHKRGASLSKLDDHSGDSIPSTINNRTSRMSSSAKQNIEISGSGESEAGKVKLRIRERSTSGVRDAGKRHSWSPRTSLHEPIEHIKGNKESKYQQSPLTIPKKTSKESHSKTTLKTTPTTTIENTSSRNTSVRKLTDMPLRHQVIKSGDSSRIKTTAKSFTPRSTALQLALNKFELICPEPPLDDFIKNCDDANETVSEAGTYTVDGDNYTEEQKELMNIDKSYTESSDLITNNNQLRPNELHLHQNKKIDIDCGLSENQKRNNNILEINYYHDSTSLKPKISYLEKIKSRVRRSSPSEKKLNSPSDVGTFTSVTTSGVLSVKPTLDSHPKMTRRNSLIKSQVDSSEYISTTLNSGEIISENSNNTNTNQLLFTDHQKAEYKLNLFTTSAINQTDSQILNESYNCGSGNDKDIGIPPTPDSPTTSFSKSIISETGLKTAQSKNDWIQEWARNARARSQSATTTHSSSVAANEQMSRSYNFDPTTIAQSATVMSSSYRNKNNKTIIDNNRFLRDDSNAHTISDFEYSSDPNVSIINGTTITTTLNSRPPMSPSKIPSPMHTVGRARSASRTRGSLQDLSPTALNSVEIISPADNTDIYLQKTADAISNLSQSFSRKNSFQSSTAIAMKSPPSASSAGNSPRHHHIYPQHYSADEYSPTNTNITSHHPHYHYHNGEGGSNHLSQHKSNVHKRNLSYDYRNNLMSHSLNTETLATILAKQKQCNNVSNNQQRSRQHSYDGGTVTASIATKGDYNSPKLFQRKAYIDQTTGAMVISKSSSIKQPYQQSPIRRSSSFSVKQQQPNTISIGRTTNTQKSTEIGKNPIQKSASSNSFRKMYSDYDDNIAYYINDEDDLIDAEYYGSSDDYDDVSDHAADLNYISSSSQQLTAQKPVDVPQDPLTNTRYNKALLMRIERSKQRVAGSQTGTGKPSSSRGVIACPNTPEMPRRAVQSASRASVRQSVPRDSSLSRLKAEVPNSLASAKKQLLQTAAATNLSKKVQPKYMDISKYKPVQGANFLRKDEKKSTLMTRSTEIKRSPSTASVSLNRSDLTRASNRSVRSTGTGGSGGRPGSSSSRRGGESSAPKQKEVELAMWKRRATYDPMKSAAEDRKRREEAKRSANTTVVQSQQQTQSAIERLPPQSQQSSLKEQSELSSYQKEL